MELSEYEKNKNIDETEEYISPVLKSKLPFNKYIESMFFNWDKWDWELNLEKKRN